MVINRLIWNPNPLRMILGNIYARHKWYLGEIRLRLRARKAVPSLKLVLFSPFFYAKTCIAVSYFIKLLAIATGE